MDQQVVVSGSWLSTQLAPWARALGYTVHATVSESDASIVVWPAPYTVLYDAGQPYVVM